MAIIHSCRGEQAEGGNVMTWTVLNSEEGLRSI